MVVTTLTPDEIQHLTAASTYLRDTGCENWANAIGAAIILQGNISNIIKTARSDGYQQAISYDNDDTDWGYDA